jgi:hypothetical protein
MKKINNPCMQNDICHHKKKPNLFCVLIAAITLFSCAKLPVQSVNLMQQIKDEGTRMHKLNVAYVNLFFDTKNAEVDSFIRKEYMPDVLANIKKITEQANINMNEKWQEFFIKLNPVINGVRDSLRTALAQNKNKILAKLSDNYTMYAQACDAQISLLSSATKLNATTRQIFNSTVAKVSGNKLDLGTLEKKLDGILMGGNTAAQKILLLNDAVQTIIGN